MNILLGDCMTNHPWTYFDGPFPPWQKRGKQNINKIKLSIKTSKWWSPIIKNIPYCFVINPYLPEQVPNTKILYHHVFITMSPFIGHRCGCILYIDASENYKCYRPTLGFGTSRLQNVFAHKPPSSHSIVVNIGTHFTCVAMNKSLIWGDILGQIRLDK